MTTEPSAEMMAQIWQATIEQGNRLRAQRDALSDALESTRADLCIMVREGLLEYYRFDEIDKALALMEGEK